MTNETSLAHHPQGLTIESLDLDAQGIAHKEDGKVVFVEGALPFEVVTANIHRKKNNWEQGTLKQLLKATSQRVSPYCEFFGMHAGACGGCKMQHLNMHSQIAVKQRVLEDNLWHLGKVKPELVLRPLQGPDWAYRFRARLSVRYVIKKSKVLIGFHERKSSYVADMSSCKVLPTHVSQLLAPLSDLIFDMDAKDQCPQIEVACGDQLTALILRHLVPLSSSDINKLKTFAETHKVQWWLQSKGVDSVVILDTPAVTTPENQLFYDLPEFQLRMQFRPTDFTQVNPAINKVLVFKAINLMNIKPEESVIDWFCGLGNFTLPIARFAHQVTGVEGSQPLLDWANRNFNLNASAVSSFKRPLSPVNFVCKNLFEITPEELLQFSPATKWLIDPPREGAFSLVKALADLIQNENLRGAWEPPKRIVYISCNPATLARDAGILTHLGAYRCSSTGMVNMFPHTAHVESMTVFDLN
jgi:23S rRNA (uracil1939-C5)-methyltransferase